MYAPTQNPRKPLVHRRPQVRPGALPPASYKNVSRVPLFCNTPHSWVALDTRKLHDWPKQNQPYVGSAPEAPPEPGETTPLDLHPLRGGVNSTEQVPLHSLVPGLGSRTQQQSPPGGPLSPQWLAHRSALPDSPAMSCGSTIAGSPGSLSGPFWLRWRRLYRLAPQNRLHFLAPLELLRHTEQLR